MSRDADRPSGPRARDGGGLGAFSLRQLAHFVAVADAGTISAASGHLFMSESAISASISELERSLGADLCVRRRAQGVVLTPAGRLVAEKARQLLADAAELSYLVGGHDRDLVGPLVVGCFVTLAPTVLPRLLSELRLRHPRISVDFVEGAQDRLQDALAAGEIDAAVLYDMGLWDTFDHVELYRPRGYAILGEGHPFAGRPRVALEELADEPLVLFSQPPSTDYAMSAFHARNLAPNIRHRTGSFELARSIVARGLAYAILVQRPVNKLSYEGLPILEKEVEPPLPECPVVLAWPRDRRPSPRVRALAALAGEQYRSAATT